MIIQEKSGTVARCGVVTEVACSIDPEDMRRISSMLRDNYSDPIWATVREIIANAVDANNENDIRIGAVVELPSKFKAEFTVRDYGKGLPQEDIFGLYSKYGKSTKRVSNQGIGGFGIGRFAPLSYSGSFMVESFCNGNLSTYSVFIDEFNDTKISMMDSKDTKEPNGIRIVVGVNPDDINDFRDHILKLDFFGDLNLVDPKGKLLRDVYAIEYPIQEIVYSGNGWKAVKGKISDHVVTMGGIPYPIKLDQLRLRDKVREFTKAFWKGGGGYSWRYRQCDLVWIMEVEIGKIGLHHSREALEYNDETREVLTTCISGAYTELEYQFNQKIQNAASFEDACGVFGNVVKEVGDAAFVACFDMPLYNGRKLIYRYSFPHTHNCYGYYADTSKDSGYCRHKIPRGANRDLVTTTAFLLRDDDSQIIPKVRYLCEEKGFKNIFVIPSENIEGIKKSNCLDDLPKYVFKLSTCGEKLVIKRGTRSRKNPAYAIKKLDLNRNYYCINHLPAISSDTLPTNETLYYIPVYRGNYSDDDYKTERGYVESSVDLKGLADLAGLNIKEVYLIPKSSRSKFKNDKKIQWKNFFNVVGLVAHKKFEKETLTSSGNSPFWNTGSLDKSALMSLYKRRIEIKNDKIVDKITSLVKDNRDFLKIKNTAKNKECDKIKAQIKLIEKYADIKISLNFVSHNLGKDLNEFEKEHLGPLCELCCDVLSNERSDRVVDFIISLLNEIK